MHALDMLTQIVAGLRGSCGSGRRWAGAEVETSCPGTRPATPGTDRLDMAAGAAAPDGQRHLALGKRHDRASPRRPPKLVER